MFDTFSRSFFYSCKVVPYDGNIRLLFLELPFLFEFFSKLYRLQIF